MSVPSSTQRMLKASERAIKTGRPSIGSTTGFWYAFLGFAEKFGNGRSHGTFGSFEEAWEAVEGVLAKRPAEPSA